MRYTILLTRNIELFTGSLKCGMHMFRVATGCRAGFSG